MYSTVISALAGEPLIFEALTSVEGQTRPPEVVYVVVDGGSGPDPGWISTIRSFHPLAKVVHSPGSGQASALAHGISLVDTPYVAFLDCDDIWLPRKQEFQIEHLHKSRDVDAVTCLAQNVDPGGGRCGRPLRAMMFTAATFRTSVFVRFGMPDVEASHYAWLYRWWSSAISAGINTTTIDYLGLHRRIHGKNSWITGQQQAKNDLMAELRRLSSVKRGESN